MEKVLNSFVGSVIFFQDSLINKTVFIWNINIFNNINVPTVNFDQFNASLLK